MLSLFSSLRKSAGVLALLCAVALVLVGCGAAGQQPPTGDCRPQPAGVVIQPTATVYADPPLTPAAASQTAPQAAAPQVAAPQTAALPYCTPAAPPPTRAATATPVGYGAGTAVNLTLTPEDETVWAAAVGRRATAVVWQDSRGLTVAASLGEGDWRPRSLGAGQEATLRYSPADRLHLAYVRDGRLYYRAAAADRHPADAPETALGYGRRPSLALDGGGWARLLYAGDGGIYVRRQGPTGWSEPAWVGEGERVAALFTAGGRLLAATQAGTTVRLYSQEAGGSGWQLRAVFAAPGTISGSPRLDSDGGWVCLAFGVERPDFQPGGVLGWESVLYAACAADEGRTWPATATAVVRNEAEGRRGGRFQGAPYPLIALAAEPQPVVHLLFVYEEGDPPLHQPGALRYGRPRLATCVLGEPLAAASCSPNPGLRLLPAGAARPTVGLTAAVAADRQRGLLAWDAWQPGETAKEVYAATLRAQTLWRIEP
jgi:hypothetical protein